MSCCSTFNSDHFPISVAHGPFSVGNLISENGNDEKWDTVEKTLLDAHHPTLGDEQPGVVVAEDVLLGKPVD